jgi:NAD(P)H-dependent flavin oxidoreductase YrpB (nitropropane dioxygenase family)
MQNKITELFNIKYPTQAGWSGQADGNLQDQVSNNGGLGILAGSMYPEISKRTYSEM